MHVCRRFVILFPILLTLLFSCGDDENELTQKSYFTGLWRMETPPPLVEVVFMELEQDGAALEGNFYLERLGELGEAMPLLNGSISGSTASFDMDVSALPEEDGLRFIVTLDTLRCYVVIAIAPEADTTALPKYTDLPAFEEKPLPFASTGRIEYRHKNVQTEPVRIDTSGHPCPLDTIWIGLEEPDTVEVQFTATGGTPPYFWGAGGLPFGLFINESTGVISGVPLEIAGEYEFYVGVASLEDVETIHLQATLSNPGLLSIRMERCAPGLCVTDRIPAERKSPGF